jgi:hypothetical protein
LFLSFFCSRFVLRPLSQRRLNRDLNGPTRLKRDGVMGAIAKRSVSAGNEPPPMFTDDQLAARAAEPDARILPLFREWTAALRHAEAISGGDE